MSLVFTLALLGVVPVFFLLGYFANWLVEKWTWKRPNK